jgi:glycerol-3-phosphate acyltransferase PlsX
VRIAIDAMGSDKAVAPEVGGAITAAKQWPQLSITLVGDEARIQAEAAKHGGLPSNIIIRHTTEVITPDEEPVKAVRTKKNASMVVAGKMVKDGEADAMLTAGSTGALVVVGTLGIGRMKGVERPALGTVIPTVKQPTFFLDIGATIDPRPEWLVQFALMGDVYAKAILGRQNPKVALLNNGAEAEKGNALTKATYPLLQAAKGINFIGNVEGRDVPFGVADVVVAEGFSGNVHIKTLEGTAMALMKEIKGALTSSFTAKLGALLAKGGLKQIAKKFDYTEIGGALLMGLKGPVVKCHGSSDAKAITSGIRFLKQALEQNVVEKIRAAIEAQGPAPGGAAE